MLVVSFAKQSFGSRPNTFCGVIVVNDVIVDKGVIVDNDVIVVKGVIVDNDVIVINGVIVNDVIVINDYEIRLDPSLNNVIHQGTG